MDRIKIRNVIPEDHKQVIEVIPNWWGGRDLSSSVPKLFFIHFSPTSFVAEQDGVLIGFLIGFLSQTYPEEGYIHFAGVHPEFRNQGLAKRLYETFFKRVRQEGRTRVRSCTALENKLSIGFHRQMGFSLEPGDRIEENIPVTIGYLSERDKKVVFTKDIREQHYH